MLTEGIRLRCATPKYPHVLFHGASAVKKLLFPFLFWVALHLPPPKPRKDHHHHYHYSCSRPGINDSSRYSSRLIFLWIFMYIGDIFGAVPSTVRPLLLLFLVSWHLTREKSTPTTDRGATESHDSSRRYQHPFQVTRDTGTR